MEVSSPRGAAAVDPADVAGHCCATPWSSKGYRRGQDHMAAKTAAALWRWSDGGALPVVIDATSCAHGLLEDVAPRLDDAERERFAQIEVLDSIAWAHDQPAAAAEARAQGGIRGHPPDVLGRPPRPWREARGDRARAGGRGGACPSARPAAAWPAIVGCCIRSCPASALRDEAAALAGHSIDEYLCSNRTCEIGLQEVTGAPYASFIFLLEEAHAMTLWTDSACKGLRASSSASSVVVRDGHRPACRVPAAGDLQAVEARTAVEDVRLRAAFAQFEAAEASSRSAGCVPRRSAPGTPAAADTFPDRPCCR